MRKILLPVLAVSALLAGISSCTTKKDGFAYRVYHNTTAHFNGHFNAGESVKKGVEKIRVAHKDDYDQILPVFIYGDEETAKTAYPEMEKAIGKCEKVISRHTMTNEEKKGKKHPVFNKWIDENYMLIGQSYFYKKNYLKAEEVFQFVSRKYKDENIQATSATWLARSYIQREEYSKAVQALNRVEIEGELEDELKADYYLVYADLYIRQEKLELAAEKMEMAIKHIRRKKDRARPHFILAQIYQQLNKSAEAQREYDAVVHSRPPYELEFYSRINKALAYSRRGGSSDEIKKELFKMLKDEKNINYRDQIYYALGDIALEEQKRDEAIAYFEQSLEANTDNKKQKAKTFLRLADLYFDQRAYSPAQEHYDSTFRNITEEHPRYREIKARAESLTDLVNYLNTITLNDSLISLCELSEADREKMLRRAQKQIEEEMARKREEDERRASEQQEDALAGVSGTFWIYNANLRDKGHDNFVDYWGDRPLKDNWRLSSRLSSSYDAPDESQVAVAGSDSLGGGTAEDQYKVPSLDELRDDLPCGDDARIDAARVSTAEAYYQAGVIYKENLDDEDNAINSWEQLIRNMESSEFHPVAHYQLFRTWLSKEQLSNYKRNPFCETCDSKYWAAQIHEKYPGSEWAMLVDNPEYFDIKDLKEQQEREAYELVYGMYAERNYPAAITACNAVITNEPDNHLLCRYRLLRAICVGYSDAPYALKENFLKELNEVKANCPGSDEATRADELIRAANSDGSALVEDPRNDEATGDTTQVKPDTPAPAGPNFEFDEKAEHYFVLVVPVQGSEVNKTKASISDFNAEFYTSAGLKVTNNLLDKSQHIILVKPFKTIPEASDYMATFTTNSTKLADINAAGNLSFIISKPNYIQLFKSKNLDAYIEFYNQNYQ